MKMLALMILEVLVDIFTKPEDQSRKVFKSLKKHR